MNNSKKVSWGTICSVSAVAFGIHVGGGFATGNQTVNFFVQYGKTAVFFPIIAMFLLNLVFRSAVISAQINKATNYREWSDGAFAPYEKVLSIVFELCFIIITIMAVAASIAGAAALLEDYGMSYLLGVVIVGIAFLVLTLYGKELVAKAATAMSICIVICMLILCYVGLTIDGGDLSSALQAPSTSIGYGAAIWSMLQYVGFQSYTGATLAPYAATLKTKRNVTRMVIVNFFINTFMIVLTALTLLAWYNKVQGTTLPILEIANLSEIGWLRYAYSVALFLAFVTTGVGCTFAAVARFENKIFKKMKITSRRAIVSVIAMALAMGMSTVGLTAIVAKGYSKLGILGIFIMIIPCLSYIWARNKKGKVTRKIALETEITG